MQRSPGFSRDGLLAALLPAPGADLPALEALDLAPFWARFDRDAPAHLRLGLAAAALLIGGLLPRALGHRAGLGALDPAARDAVLARAGALPLLADLLEVAKVVACLAYFDDGGVQARWRGGDAGATAGGRPGGDGGGAAR